MLTSTYSYIHAFEVGQGSTSAKYDLAVRFRTLKNGPTVRNRLRLPHPVNTSLRIAVICPPESSAAASAKKAGAALVGEHTVFDAVKEGRIEFDRCICHPDSTQKMQKAGLGKILGPRGLMPSTKLGTVVKDVAGTVRNMAGGSEYREKLGVVRMAIGQLGFTPEEMQKNVKTFMEEIKKDLAALSDRINKEIHEVVGFSKNSVALSPAQDDRQLDFSHIAMLIASLYRSLAQRIRQDSASMANSEARTPYLRRNWPYCNVGGISMLGGILLPLGALRNNTDRSSHFR